MHRTLFAALVLLAGSFAVTRDRQAAAAETPADWPITVTTASTPAAANSGQPQLSVSSRGVLLSWVERDGARATLKFSERSAGAWSPARTIASGEDWFVNWADVPSVTRLADGTLVAHWLQKSGADTYAYDVRLTRSKDDGKTWERSWLPHSDGTKTEHGFASIFEMPGSGLGLVWLDGRAMAGGHAGAGGHAEGDMSLRFGAFAPDGKQTAEAPLDLRVCECCPTAAAMTADGPIVAYRDRSPEELRDISITRLENGKWTAPVPVHKDEWKINACPVNGPALSARGKNVAVAWFQAKDNAPKSFAAFSSDAGRSFGPPARLDVKGSLGRVDIELLPDGAAAAAYVEYADSKATFMVRRVERNGTLSAPVTVAAIAGNRSSGYPRMALHGDELVFAWTDRDGGATVRTATARVPRQP
jgi:hypothetical protein